MNRKELYLSYAADCQQMAYVTRNEHERLTWLDMAQSWLQLAQVSSAPLESQLDKSRRNAAWPNLSQRGIGWEFRSLRFGGTAELKSPNRMRRMMLCQMRTNGSHFR